MDEYRNILEKVDRLCKSRTIPMSSSLVEDVKKAYEKCLSLAIDSEVTPLMLALDWKYDDLVWGYIQCAKQTNTNLHTGGTLNLQEFLGYRNSSGETALHVAAKEDAYVVICVLLKEVSVEHLISYRDQSGNTPISLMEPNDHYKYADRIFEVMEAAAAASKGDHHVDATTTDDKPEGLVRVHTEIKMDPNSRPRSHVNETRESLKKLDGGVLELTENKSTILHLVSELGDTAYAKDILEKHPSLVHNQNILGETPFYVAAREGHIDILEILISYAKSDKIEELATRSTDKDTALHIAIKKNHVGVVFWLVKRIPQLANHVNDLNQSPLYLAARYSKYVAVVELIVKECKEKSYDGPDGQKALHAAVMHKGNSARGIRALLLRDNIGLLKIQDKDGWTPLHYAAKFGHSDMIIFEELKRRSDLFFGKQMMPTEVAVKIITSAFEIIDRERRNMLHVAIEYKQLDIIRLIFQDESLTISLISQKDSNGNTPLHILMASSDLMKGIMMDAGTQLPYVAAKLGRLDILRNLLENRTDYIGNQMMRAGERTAFDFTDTNGKNMLHVAIEYKQLDVIELIFKDESLIRLINQKDGRWNTPLHLLMASDLEMNGIRMDARFDFQVKDSSGWTPLHCAAKFGCSDIIRNLLENIAKQMKTADAETTSAFEILDWEGRNMLHVAIEYKQIDVIELIFGDESLISVISKKDSNGNTPLHLLMASPDLPMEGIMMDARFPFQVQNNQNCTPLHMASSQEKKEILNQAMGKLEIKHGKTRRLWKDLENEAKESIEKIEKEKKKRVFGKIGDNVVLVVTLIATATFAAAFTVPGGFDGNEGPDQGMPILLRKAAYKAFVVANALAFSCSCAVLFLHIRLQLDDAGKEEKDGSDNIISLQYLLTGIAMVAMAIAFVTGTYVILTPSLGFAISVCAMCLCIMVPSSIFPRKRLGFASDILRKLA